MVDITDEEAADLSPIESGPIKGEWIREVIDNSDLVGRVVDKVAAALPWYDKKKVVRIKQIIPTYDQEDFAGLSQMSTFLVDRLASSDLDRVSDQSFSSRVSALLEEQVGIIKEEELLGNNKIVPIYLPNNKNELSAFLGSGMFGKVLRAAYKGKQVAVKIVGRGREDKQWAKLKQLSDSAPPEISKHLPVVYDIIEDGEKTLIVMELLKPATNHLTSFFDFGEGDSYATTKDLFDDRQLIWAMHNQILREIPEIGKSLGADLGRALFDFKGQSLDELIPFLKSGVVTPLSQQQTKYINKYIDHIVWHVRKHLAERFPSSSGKQSEYSDRFSRTPETSGLLAALRYLSAGGLNWGDVHAANVMMRPSGDLVIIDVGLYGIG